MTADAAAAPAGNPHLASSNTTATPDLSAAASAAPISSAPATTASAGFQQDLTAATAPVASFVGAGRDVSAGFIVVDVPAFQNTTDGNRGHRERNDAQK